MSNEDKYGVVMKAIGKDPLGADLLLSLLIAASSSYRHDTVLRPFPLQYTSNNEEEKHYQELDKVLNKIPSLRKLGEVKKDTEVTDIIHWCIKHGKFVLRTCAADKFSVIAALTGHSGGVPTPTHIFEVRYCQAQEEKFQERRGDKDLMYGYHGSRLENFHCILHFGLQGHMNKNALFGEGTYLSSELTVSMPYAPAGSGWKESLVGEKLSCIAVCEVIDDPKSVKCQEKERGADSGSGTRNRARIADSLGGDIPEKYYVVRNNDSLRVKYLLVYAEKSKPRDLRRSWVYQHKFTVMIVVYAVILLLVGFFNSQLGQKVKKYYRS